MFQWVEHEKREEKESKYTYSKEWCEYDVDSDDFKDSYHHRNPSRYPPLYSETIKHQSQAMVGAYILAERQIDKMRRYRICPIPSESLEQGPLSGFHVEQASIHTSAIDDSDSSYQQQCQCSMVSWASQKTVDFLVYNGYLRHPEVGTIRISYEALVEGDDVSLVGVQQQLFHPDVPFRPFLQSDANAMEPWVVSYLTRHCGACSGCGCCCACCVALSSCADLCAKAIVGNDVLLVEERLTTLNAMFTNERANLGWRAIAVRILGCLLLSMGFYLVFDPIATVLSFIPYVSGLLHSFFWVVALLLGFTTGGFIIAAAWVLYRPLYLAVLSTTISYFLGPFDTIAGVALLVCGVLSFLLALLHLLDDRNYSRRVDSELSSRPTGYLEVEKVHDAYPDAHPTAPPLSGKFKSMNIE